MTKSGDPGTAYQLTLFALEAVAAAVPTTHDRDKVDHQLTCHKVDNSVSAPGSPLAQGHFTEGERWNPADFGEVPHKTEADGQVTIFWDDTQEPPDPDDYATNSEYEQAWREWMAARVLEQDTSPGQLLSDDSQKFAGDRQFDVLEQDTQKPVPEHKTPGLEPTTGVPEHTQWVEEYRPSTRKANSYYRYCYKQRRKIYHIHIPGGNTRSHLAQNRKAEVESAIASGNSPGEIRKLISSWKCDRTQPSAGTH